MFKKKQVPEQQRGRNRTSQPLPRNTAVFSYHANRSTSLESRERTMQEPEPRPKRVSRFGLQRIGSKHVLSVILIIIFFLLSVGLDTRPKIVILGDSSNKFALQDTKVYEQAAHTMLGKSFANNNKLTINTEAVADQLQNQFPEVHAVSISLPFIGRKPTVYIQPATPQMVLSASNGQFILDSNGRALANYSSATDLPSDRAVPIITDQSGLTFKKGDVALSSNSVAFIAEIAGQFQAKGIKAETWTLPAAASQLNVKVSGVPYSVRFNLQGNAREQAGTFLAVKQRLDGEHTIPAEYIDVRVSGRAYYK